MERKMFDTPVLPRLETILAEVKSGDLMIPEFQRPFIWDDERRLLLLDSIVAGMPIGSLLVWRTNRRDLATYKTLGGVRLDGASVHNDKLNYLIDGHQRISTLFGALYSGPLDSIGVANEPRWRAYYELGAGDRPAFRLPPRRGPVPDYWLPLHILLDGDQLFEFTQRLRSTARRSLAKEAERLANVFRDYIVPIVPLITEELNVVTDAFVRINTQGKGMSEAHMLRALTHLGSIDTDVHFGTVRERLEPKGWGSLDDQVLVNVLKAQFDLDVYASSVRGVHERLKEDSAPLMSLAGVLEEVVDFLAEVGVRGPGALPYTYQLVTLATLAAWSPGILGRRDAANSLGRWFWISTYTEYFSGITGSRIRDTIHSLNSFLPPAESIDLGPPVRHLTQLRGSTGRTKAFLLFLAQLPQSEVGRQARQECLAAESVLNLVASGSNAEPGNRVLANPSELRQLRAALKDRLVAPDMADEFGIPDAAMAQLPDLQGFLRERTRWLVERERSFIGGLGLMVSEPE